MYFLAKFCSTCLENNDNVISIPKTSDINTKLSKCFKDVEWSFLQQLYMCPSCQRKLDAAFEFKETCLKSVGTLRKYVGILKEDGNVLKRNVSIRLSRNEVPKELINDYKLKNTVNVNSTSSNPNGVVIPNTNVIFNPFSFYGFLPANTVLPMVQQPMTNFRINPQLNVPSRHPFNFQPVPSFQPTINSPVASKVKTTGTWRPLVRAPPPNFVNHVPQFLIINQTSPTVRPNEEPMQEVHDMLKNIESEEMSVSVDPMAFNILDDESDSNTSRILLDHEMFQMNQTEETMKPKLTKPATHTCTNCNAAFNNGKELRLHRKANYNCYQKYYQKGKKLAQCPICGNEYCSEQYLQKHLTRCSPSKVKRKQKRQVNVRKRAKKIKKEDVNKKQENGVDMKEVDFAKNTNPETSTSKLSPQQMKPAATIMTDTMSKLNLSVIKVEPTDEMEIDSTDKQGTEQKPALIDNADNVPDTTLVEETELPSSENSGLKKPTGTIKMVIKLKEISKTKPLRKITSDKTEPFNCEYCSQSCGNAEQHFNRVHKNTMHIRCQFCHDLFMNGAVLEDHLTAHYNYFKCASCNESFTDVKQIPIHMAMRHDTTEPVICVSCNEQFETNESILVHSELHLENLVYVCHVCNKKYKKSVELNVHLVEHFENIICLFCHQKCSSGAELKAHTEFCYKLKTR